MWNRMLDAACAAMAVVVGLGVMGCQKPPCKQCGLAPNAQYVAVDPNGGQRPVNSDSNGCVTYTCGARIQLVPINGGPIVTTPGQS